MSWKEPTPEQWMRLGFVVLVIVGIVSTFLIVAVKLK